MSRLFAYCRRLGSLDPRSLACFRIGLAIVALYDAAEAWTLLEVWAGLHGFYAGLPLPALAGPGSEEWLLRLALIGWGLAAIGLLLGYRTRLCALGTWLGACGHHFVSTHTTDFHGVILCNFLMWGQALPLGRCFSFDARHRPPSSDRLETWGSALFVLFFACLYLGAAVEKTGAAWWSEGSALWLALNDIEAAGAPARWATAHLPLWVFRLGTHLTWGIETAAALLILSPWRRSQTRLAACALLVCLHWGMWILMDIGPFPPTMIAGALVLAPAMLWDRAGVAISVTPTYQPGWTGRQKALVLLAVLVALGYSEGNRLRQTVAEERWPYPGADWIARLRYFMALEYRWNMYAPQPPALTGWWIGVGIDAQGRELDPITGKKPTLRPPIWGHPPFAGRQGYYWSSSPDIDGWPQDEYIRYLRWLDERQPTGRRLTHLTLFYAYEPLDWRRPGQRPLYLLPIAQWPQDDDPRPKLVAGSALRQARLFLVDYDQLGNPAWKPQELPLRQTY